MTARRGRKRVLEQDLAADLDYLLEDDAYFDDSEDDEELGDYNYRLYSQEEE